MYILGVESSCDESAASVVKAGRRQGPIAVLSNIISSQIDIHKKYGGVVPEIAARAHVDRLMPLVEQALGESGLALAEVDAIAATAGPGLIGGVMAGVMLAKGLSAGTGLPLVGVNHLEAHIYSAWLNWPV